MLRDAEFFVMFAGSAIILIFALSAYKRTKKIAFALFVVASAIAIVEGLALYRLGSIYATLSPSEREKYSGLCRIAVIVASIMGTAATVWLICLVPTTAKPEA
jgi:glucan phosphoethanolaminetransferase (alkaline phosphatase superfamily)